jgi:hypothetical protein
MHRANLVLHAYGLDEIRVQGLYAAWSALAHRGGLPLTVHVYTDAPDFFAPLAAAGLETRVLSDAEIQAWKGPCNFVHRLKAEMLREMVRRFPDDKLLYLDADVIVTSPMAVVFDRIAPGSAVMHLREYNVATRQSEQLRKFRRRMGRLAFRGAPLDLGGDMWNAGAVGIHPAQFGVVDAWIEFIDTLYPKYPRGLVEQYGISLLLQRAATVTPCEAEVLHYWFQKDEYVAAIRRELELLRARPFEDAAAHLRAHRISLPPPERRRHKTTLLGRIGRALRRGA